MALAWHPDKNPDNMEEAKVQFQLIQAAYDTLSDPQERAFYDRNRDSILRGKASGSDPKPETIDLFEYFSSQCYSGFSDSEKGFYTVYRQVFEKIAAKDMQYMNDEEEEIIIPNFGCSDTDLEDVAEFYGYWSSYCTSMDFHWADEYDIREAQRIGRWAEKRIEKDNNKARQKARKQFNEEVRALVAFVRKRDKRWIARKKIMEAKIAENAQKQEACQRRQREARQIMMKEDVEQEKANLAAYEDELKAMQEKFAEEWGLSGSESSEYFEEDEEDISELSENKALEKDEDNFQDDLYCVACNKFFKTEKSMESHQRSKKHKESLERLKAAMLADDKEYFKDDSQDSKVLKDNSQSDDNDAQQTKSLKKKKKKKKTGNTALTEELPSPVDPSPLDKRKKSRKKTRQDICEIEIKVGKSDKCSESETENDDIVINDHNDASKQAKEIPVSVKSEETDYINLENCESESTPSVINTKNDERTKLESDSENSKKPEIKPKLKGKKAKEARKQAREASNCVEPDMSVNKCTVCGSIYSSKNKLFTHIKAEGHAAFKTPGKEVKGKIRAKK